MKNDKDKTAGDMKGARGEKSAKKEKSGVTPTHFTFGIGRVLHGQVVLWAWAIENVTALGQRVSVLLRLRVAGGTLST